jgi:peptidoglycan/LPS O-acetylase OafA/YrhL
MKLVERRDAGERLIGLELLRFLAAIGVLIWHYQHFMFVGHEQTAWDWGRLPFRSLFLPFYTYGYQGVELFWCISGFIFTWKYGRLIGRTGMSFGRFAMLRFSRLYPLHLAMLLTVAALQCLYSARYGETFVYRFNDTAHFVMNLLFANWWGFQSGESFNGPSWSVSAEVLIYVVFFWVTRRAGSRWWVDLLALLGFSFAAPVAKSLFGIKLAFTGAGTFFYLGALTCHLHEWIQTSAARRRQWFAWGCAGLIAACVVLVATHGLKIAGASLPMFPAAVLLVQLAVRPKAERPKGERLSGERRSGERPKGERPKGERPSGERLRMLLTGLGNLTYASYMLHFPMQLSAMLILGALAVPVQSLAYSDWFMLAYLGGVLAAAFVVFHVVERPAQALLRGWGQRNKVSAKVIA